MNKPSCSTSIDPVGVADPLPWSATLLRWILMKILIILIDNPLGNRCDLFWYSVISPSDTVQCDVHFHVLLSFGLLVKCPCLPE